MRRNVRRRWDDGSLLRAWAVGQPFPVVDVPLRGPAASEIGDDLPAVRAWITALEREGRHSFALHYKAIGGRHIGRNQVPERAVVETYEQAWALLGVGADVARFDTIAAEVAAEPAVASWVSSHPLVALDTSTPWTDLLAAYRWLRSADSSGRYLREIDVPGIDTKFVERNRPLLAKLLDVPPGSGSFLTGLGLRRKPELIRIRPHPGLRLADGLSELTVRFSELAQLDLTVRTALIVENEITFLSVPVPDHGIVLWGKGFEVDRAGSMPWLVDADVVYWGDLDTHGFAILHRLRAWLPQTRSLLMDRATLLEHRGLWTVSSPPSTARLARLTADESALYEDLVTDRFGVRVQVEQERINWAWAVQALRRAGL